MSAYQTLKRRWHEAARIDEAAGILHWDQSVIMPPGGSTARADHLSILSGLSHKLRTQEDMADLLVQAADEDLQPWDRRNLDLIYKKWHKENLVPGELVEALSNASLAAERAWGKARDRDDFGLVQDELQRSFDLTRQRAMLLADAMGQDPYDILMDDFEPGLTQAIVDPIFADYAAFLPDFLTAVQARQASAPALIRPEGPFDINVQRGLGEDLMRALGFDFSEGRLDVSRHPFCGGHAGDIRMTTRYDEADFTKALMGVLHETGHGLYEAGLPRDYATQPVGSAAGLAAHESQALLFEMQACRGNGFLAYLAEQARKRFGGEGPAWSVENLTCLYRHVEPGRIRVDADEVTYPAHVMLRYELEKALFSGEIKIADLPAAFADGLEARLGVRPHSDFDGVLQDIHWYSGGFGYFATYTMGAMTAAQLFAAARSELESEGTSLNEDLGRGDFSRLLGWLRTHVHGRGRMGTTHDILVAATGRGLDPECFKSHLKSRYLGES